MSGTERYKRSVPDRRHAYSDYPSSVSILSRALKSPDLFVERIAELLKKRTHSDKSKNIEHNSRSRARKIFDDLKSGGGSLNELEKEIVSKALDKGFFEDVGLDEAWHPHNFLSDNCGTTFPLQHDTCVLYTGQNKRIFFSKPGKQDIKRAKGYDSFTNPRSIFDQGYIAKSDTDKTSSINDAVFFTFDYRHAAANRYGGSSFEGLYEASIVFEVEVPSRWLTICRDPMGKAERFRSLEELREEYDSPSDFRQRVVKGDMSVEEKVQFELEKTGLPLEYITGVWDLERDDDPTFYPLSSYHKLIYGDFPFRVPWKGENISWSLDSNEAEQKRVEKLESKNIFEIEKLIEQVENLSEQIIDLLGLNGSIGLLDGFNGSIFRQKTLNGKSIPLGCETCGNVFKQDEYYCQACGREIKDDWDVKFDPVSRLQELESGVKALRKFLEDPLHWRQNVKRRWDEGNVGDKEAPVLPWRIAKDLAKENYRYVYSLERYVDGLTGAFDEIEESKEEKLKDIKRIKAIKNDLNQCKEDLDRISS